MPSLSAAEICHFTARRLRLRVPERRRDPAFFEAAAERLSRWPSVERVETNALTASILIYCSDVQTLFAEAAVAGNDLFEIDFDNAFKSNSDTVVDRAARSFDAADATLRRWTEGQIDIRGLLFVVMFVGGIYQLFRGRLAAPAPTLLWRAGDLLGLWDRLYRDPRDRVSAASAVQTSSDSPPSRVG
jgi:hypothetical protein